MRNRLHLRKLRVAGVGIAAAAAALAISGCRVGPDYHPPAAPLAPSFADAPAPAAKQQAIGYSDWWKLYQDPQLDQLETAADAANQDVRAAIQRVNQATAVTAAARSFLYPTLSAQPSVGRTREAQQRPNNGNTGGRAATYNDYQLPLVLNYEIDVWGRVRRTVEAERATQQASVDDLRIVRLSTEAAVAMDYYQLRETDQELGVVDHLLEDFRQSVQLNNSLFQHGLASQLEVAQARTLLEQTDASAQSLKTQRDQLQHALAVLVGKTPESFTLPAQPPTPQPPAIPVGLPSDLLERRPDIAEADRNVATATARIGIARAAYFPQLSLTGLAGYESSNIGSLLNWQNSIASLAASAVAPIFNGGRLRAGVNQAEAAYRETLAQYSQTVLTSYQQVEDQLSALHHLADQATLQGQAVQDATRAEQMAMDQYKHGLVSYLDVVTAQQAVLFNQRTETQISGQRLVASVVLVKALGGGWEATKTP